MAYPSKVDVFQEKLNKNPTGNNYVIEERITLVAGVYEGLLNHDNINNATVQVYSGNKLTGDKLTNWTLTIPSDTPWRRLIKIFSGAAEVYVTYETPGDTVEADDINVLQKSVTATQTEVERYKSSGLIDGGSFTRGV
ncbi:phosphoglucomutase [Paenibacillus sp. FSL R7-0048]|uniref:phosphoglucomutase n=1 Tax=Paenibacillus TaxID=44249 RepID=UPI00096DB8FA|nr:phosphoglucomutase [Paenibacillus odorifer]OMD73371.1 phosphoglucomutase [Paenibacillus odorifer]